MGKTIGQLGGIRGDLWNVFNRRPCTDHQTEQNWLQLVNLLDHILSTVIPDAEVPTLPPADPVLIEATADGPWVDASPHPYVDCHDVDAPNAAVRVYLPRSYDGDPNVQGGETVIYALDSHGTAFAVSDYMDDKIGTMKFWADGVGTIPAGWALMNGIANASGSGIDLMGYMIECSNTASDGEQPATNTGASGSIGGFAPFVGLTGPAGFPGGSTGLATADVVVSFGGGGTTASATETGVIGGGAAYTSEDVVCIQCACVTVTGSSCPTSLSTALQEICVCQCGGFTGETCTVPEHVHTLCTCQRSPCFSGGVTAYHLLCKDYTETANSHAHCLEIPSHTHNLCPQCHSHAISPNPHSHCIEVTGGSHTHTACPHMHDVYDHSHTFTPAGHVHAILAHNHDAYSLPHSHTIDVGTGLHQHDMTHSHTVTVDSHVHSSGKPVRKYVIPIERIA